MTDEQEALAVFHGMAGTRKFTAWCPGCFDDRECYVINPCSIFSVYGNCFHHRVKWLCTVCNRTWSFQQKEASQRHPSDRPDGLRKISKPASPMDFGKWNNFWYPYASDQPGAADGPTGLSYRLGYHKKKFWPRNRRQR